MAPNKPMCCSVEVFTPYCPICGKKVRKNSVLFPEMEEVLAYLKTRVQSSTYQLQQISRGKGKGKPKNVAANIEKWKRWRDGTFKLLSAAEDLYYDEDGQPQRSTTSTGFQKPGNPV